MYLYIYYNMNNQIEKTKSFLNLLGKQELIGSASKDNKMLYSADIDLQETIKSKKDDVDLQEKILKLFQNKFKKAKKSKNLFITDFKAGVSPINNLPLKWSYDDIMNGYKLLDNNIKFQFVNVFNQKSTIKLDLVLENDNKFIEFSENYYFDLKNNKSYQQKTNEEIITSLKGDIRYYNHTKNNKLKALKRLYSLFKLTNNKNTEIIKTFLNLKMIGSKYKLKSDLEVILLMIEQNFKKVKINKIIEILKKMNYHKLSNYKTLKTIKNKIDIEIKKINNYLNEKTNNFIFKNNLQKYISTDFKGGSIDNDSLNEIIIQTYEKEPEQTINNYNLDNELSNDYAKVYHDKNSNQTIISHKGTDGLLDWTNNLMYASGLYDFTNRTKQAKEAQNKVIEKYGNENLSTIGHSQGAINARKYGKDSKEIIDVNPAFNPLLINEYYRNPNEYNIRSSKDIVSFPMLIKNNLQSITNPFWSNNHNLTIPAETNDILKEHSPDILKRLDNKKIGKK